MKKIFVAIASLVIGITASAQPYSPGQLIMFGDVPAIVITVDDSGEHGLAVSMPAVQPKSQIFYKKIWVGDVSKKEVEAAFEAHPNWMYSNSEWVYLANKAKVADKLWTEVATALWEQLGSDGEKNTEIIKQYCAEKGYKVAAYFPWVQWAIDLGDGWFCPGKNEVKAFAKFYAGGIGSEYKMLGAKWLLHAKQLAQDDFQGRYCLQTLGSSGIISSSLCKNEKGFIKPYNLITMVSKAGPYYFRGGCWASMLTTSNIAAFRKF